RPLKIDTIIKEVVKFIRASIPATIEIRQDIHSSSLVMGNPSQVHSILMNLCTNAAHSMEDRGGLLEVALKDITITQDAKPGQVDLKNGNYVELTVSDTGTGIAKEIIDSIFEPYFTTKGPGEGTGLGLAMVLGIVKSYGGQVGVKSSLGKGSVFSVYLPVTQKHEMSSPCEFEPLPHGTEKILLVDDEAAIAVMGRQVLERLGYSVTIRNSSMDALELFRSKPDFFDLVITDMTMPNMTGERLATELMNIRPNIPVILCTGYSKQITDDSAKEMGIKAFVYKPIVKSDLAKIVRSVLGYSSTTISDEPALSDDPEKAEA
ncbi:MAG: response regulator, partial [Deltaproteobacteria bacterium]